MRSESSYAASYYEAEVNNSGLCQFFVNSSRAVAPELSDTLTEIGADEHKQHFNTFVQDNGIDITDLSSFIIDDVAQFEEQNTGEIKKNQGAAYKAS